MKQSSPAVILVIEDNPADIYLLRHALSQQGDDYLIRVLRDGEEALRFVNQQRTVAEPEPCVIVLDLHLPKHDGKAVLEAIRSEPLLAHVQVVCLTSLAVPRDEEEVRDLGVRLYKAKPTELDDWMDLAAQILQICKDKTWAVFV